MFKYHILPIIGLVVFTLLGSWFVCAWEAPQYGVQLYPRYHDGAMHYDTLPAPTLEDEKWWTDIDVITDDFWREHSDLCSTEIVAEIDTTEIYEEEQDPFWRELRDSVGKWYFERRDSIWEVQKNDSLLPIKVNLGGLLIK